jgi:hypothetical protein
MIALVLPGRLLVASTDAVLTGTIAIRSEEKLAN